MCLRGHPATNIRMIESDYPLLSDSQKANNILRVFDDIIYTTSDPDLSDDVWAEMEVDEPYRLIDDRDLR